MKKVSKRNKKMKIFMENLTVYVFLFTLIASVFAIGFRTYDAFASINELKEAKTIHYVVEEGDELWNIAQDETGFDNLDPRDVVDRIKELNNLDSANIYPGDVLIIPVKK